MGEELRARSLVWCRSQPGWLLRTCYRRIQKIPIFLILMRVPPSYEPPRCTSGQDTVYITKEPDGNGVEPVGGSPEQ
jgi:hypothetical protein